MLGGNGARTVSRARRSYSVAARPSAWSALTRKITCGDSPRATYGEMAPSTNGATAVAKLASLLTLVLLVRLVAEIDSWPAGMNDSINPTMETCVACVA